MHPVSQQTPSTQNQVKQSVLPAHVSPRSFLQTPPPSHDTLGPTHTTIPFASSCPGGTFEHTPDKPATLHALQVSAQAVSQQYPSTQKPLAHCPPFMHVTPLSMLHVPAPLHAPFAHSLSGSNPVAIGPHTPSMPCPSPLSATEHASHAPVHSVSQHTPSTQKPVKQSSFAVQAFPLSILQTLAPSQAPSLHSSSGSVLITIGPHVPSTPPSPLSAAVHASQLAVHSVSQQIPSTQKPVKQSWLAVQGFPPSILQTPAPSHAPSGHSASGSPFTKTGPH
jgi:hypothetical protein